MGKGCGRGVKGSENFKYCSPCWNSRNFVYLEGGWGEGRVGSSAELCGGVLGGVHEVPENFQFCSPRLKFSESCSHLVTHRRVARMT